ncbi:hypothetical protein F5877DRAFT_84152 [Lentinula edodes]|nr:hypothetical protein F5877DRAFT_84152 [Lentinula edodes]
MDLEEIYRRLRSEFGSAVHSKVELFIAVAKYDQDLENCEAEIHRLHSRIIFLRNQHRRLEKTKEFLLFLGSPIRKLPNETLRQIFDYACESNELTSKTLRSMPALAISSVCSRWRGIVKSYPALWSRIRIDVGVSHNQLNSVLELYLNHTGKLPLLIDTSSSQTGVLVEPHSLASCAALVEHTHRWNRISIDHRRTFDVMFAHNLSQFHALETLLIPSLTLTSRQTRVNRFQSATKLRKLIIHSFQIGDLTEFKFPLEQLTILEVSRFPEEMGRIIERCSKLKELHFRDKHVSSDDYQSSAPMVAPVLQTLSLSLSQTWAPHRNNSQDCVDVVFSSLTCPSLNSLLIEASHEYCSSWPEKNLNAFISRSSFHLTVLSIKYIPLLDTKLLKLLRILPSIIHLTIDDSLPSSSNRDDASARSVFPSPITPHLLQQLNAFPTNHMAIPAVLIRRLETLDMTFSGSVAPGSRSMSKPCFSDRDFVDMVTSRWVPRAEGHCDFGSSGSASRSTSRPARAANSLESNNPACGTTCLRSVVLRFKNRGVDEEVYEPLKHLEKAGMRIVVTGI